MELVVRKNDLLRELQLFQGIVERKNTIPILANVLMEAKGDEVRFLATDLEVGLRSKCAATVAKGGSLTLPAKKFYEIVKSLPETDIRIAEDKGGVKVAADRFDSRMQTLPREDFPTLPETGGAPSATLPRSAVKEMVAKTQFAITGEDTRYFLNGALFVLRARDDEPGRDRRASPRPGHGRAGRQARKPRKRSRRSCRRRRSANSARLLTKATATSATSAARTTCSSTSAAGC